jgi:hypothetical protein
MKSNSLSPYEGNDVRLIIQDSDLYLIIDTLIPINDKSFFVQASSQSQQLINSIDFIITVCGNEIVKSIGNFDPFYFL